MTAKTSKTQAGNADPVDTTALVEAVSVERLGNLLKDSGYRVTPVEQNGRIQLMSASQGLGFSVRFGNPGGQADSWIDFTFGCVLSVQGDLPPELISDWNRTRRFARLAQHQQFVVLEMDVLLAGGVSERHVRATVELWDHLLQQFLLHLRRSPTAAAAAGTEGVEGAETKPSGTLDVSETQQ